VVAVDSINSGFISSGAQCAGCTFGVGIVAQLAQVHNESVAEAVQTVCQLFKDTTYRTACNAVILFIGPLVIQLLEQRLPPDVVCTALYLCNKTSSDEPVCHLFPRPKNQFQHDMLDARVTFEKHLKKYGLSRLDTVCDWPGIRFICQLVVKTFTDHQPAVDVDADGFSSTETFRGYSWRGHDCNEVNSGYYPGRKPIDFDREFDSNCNGIYGVDADTGIPYEKLFCEDSGQRGIILLGDSAGAHFHIPDQWLYPPDINQDTMSHLPFVVANEFDWPMLSAGTGYMNLSWSIVDGDTVSVYQMLRQRNLCNHRDYQSLAVNGASSEDALINVKSIRRNQTADHPALFVYEFVGNDVCNPFTDTIAYMTTVEQMRGNVQQLLDILDNSLPKGSHVLMMGLADGRLLYESLHSRFYPLGRLNKDIKYPDFYEFLTCLQVNPCNGWMSSNETLRDFTSQRAWELSQVIRKVVSESRNRYKNFEVNYVDCPLSQIYLDWEMKYGPGSTYQLIETVDGFHPNQIANQLFAQYMWKYVAENLPDYLGKVNPYNDQILDIFGDQGGH